MLSIKLSDVLEIPNKRYRVLCRIGIKMTVGDSSSEVNELFVDELTNIKARLDCTITSSPSGTPSAVAPSKYVIAVKSKWETLQFNKQHSQPWSNPRNFAINYLRDYLASYAIGFSNSTIGLSTNNILVIDNEQDHFFFDDLSLNSPIMHDYTLKGGKRKARGDGGMTIQERYVKTKSGMSIPNPSRKSF